MKNTSFDAQYTISSAIWNIVTFGDLCDLERSIKRFRLLQPSYNSGLTGTISMKMTSSMHNTRFYQPFGIWWPWVTSVTLKRSIKRFHLLQPSYNSGSTGPISMKVAPVDVPYAISLAVWNMVTLGDLCDLQMSTKPFPNRRNRLIDLSRSQRSPKVTIFKTADEIVYCASNDVIFIEIGSVDPEL